MKNNNETISLDFGRGIQHFKQAREALMLPHEEGEEESVKQALCCCSQMLNDNSLYIELLEEEIKPQIEHIKELMKKADSRAEGILSTEEKRELSKNVNEVADYCLKRFHKWIEGSK